MKQVVITGSFRKRLRGLRRHFSEDDVLENVKRFARSGLRAGESELKKETFGEIEVSVAKLRIRVQSAVGRYPRPESLACRAYETRSKDLLWLPDRAAEAELARAAGE